ncbi:MAG: DinB family protein [Acidobacteria bacterium]|nr:DinB family protein [Acidobacteriota bacterium]
MNKRNFSKQNLLLALCLLFCQINLLAQQQKAPAFTSSVVPSLQTEERRFLIDYLARSRQMMHDAVLGVTPEQWLFKPKPFRWSVAECAEHIILSEHWLMSEFAAKYGKSKEPAYIFHWLSPKPKPGDQQVIPLADRPRFDLFLLNDLLDRSKVDISVPRNPPPEVALVPTGKYKTPEAMLKDFDKQRDETIQIIENLKVNWRENYVYSGWKALNFQFDGYQYLVRIPAHCERHLKQLWEVKHDPNFPKQ